MKKYGVGDWVGKASRFTTSRSANSLRKRWVKLEEEGLAHPGSSTLPVTKLSEGQDKRVKVWNTQTRRALAGMSAPRRENLKRYLAEHPEMQIYTGQDHDPNRA